MKFKKNIKLSRRNFLTTASATGLNMVIPSFGLTGYSFTDHQFICIKNLLV